MTAHAPYVQVKPDGSLAALFKGPAVSLEDVLRTSKDVGRKDPHTVVIKPEGGKHLWWVTWKAGVA